MPIFLDYPSAPGRPSIVTYGTNSVDLSWIIPESDGGTDIVEYKIEYMVSSKQAILIIFVKLLKTFIKPLKLNVKSPKLKFFISNSTDGRACKTDVDPRNNLTSK